MWRRSNCQTFCRSAILHGVNNIFKPSQSLFQHDLLAKKSCCKKIRFCFFVPPFELSQSWNGWNAKVFEIMQKFSDKMFWKQICLSWTSLSWFHDKKILPSTIPMKSRKEAKSWENIFIFPNSLLFFHST